MLVLTANALSGLAGLFCEVAWTRLLLPQYRGGFDSCRGVSRMASQSDRFSLSLASRLTTRRALLRMPRLTARLHPSLWSFQSS